VIVFKVVQVASVVANTGFHLIKNQQQVVFVGKLAQRRKRRWESRSASAENTDLRQVCRWPPSPPEYDREGYRGW